MTRKALTLTVTVPVPGGADVVRWVAALPVRLGRCVLAWQRRAAERAQLAELDAHMRRDIGLSWEEVRREAEKPFWRP